MPKYLKNDETQINFRITIEKKDALIEKAKANRTTVSKLLLDYIDDYLGTGTQQHSVDIADLKERVTELEAFKERVENALGSIIKS